MDAGIRPDPTEAERRVLLAALTRAPVSREHPAYRSAWRRAGLPVAAADKPDRPAPQPSGRGATRAWSIPDTGTGRSATIRDRVGRRAER